MTIIDKLAWVYVNNKKLLVARSKGKEKYYIPGGKRDPGETDEEALVREIKEEISVDLTPSSIQHLNTFYADADGKTGDIKVKVTAYTAEFIGERKADNEIEQLAYVSRDDKARCSSVTQKIMNQLISENFL